MTLKPGLKAFSSLRILIVEDDPHTRKLIRVLLNILGTRDIIEAPDGLAAIERVESQRPDIVILDRNMPVLDGIGFMRIVRSPVTFSYPNVPVIMLSGENEKAKILEAVDAGVNEFLLKPISAKNLADRINLILHKPRPFVREGSYYGPVKRAVKMNDYAADCLAYLD